MQRTIRFFCLAVLVAAQYSFSANQSVQSRMDWTDVRVFAVVDFEAQGHWGSFSAGEFAADEMTAALYIQNHFKVIDRTQVRDYARQENLTQASMNAARIQETGDALNADFIVLGKIVEITDDSALPDEVKELNIQIQIRVLAVKDGSVIGVVENQKKSNEGPADLIKRMIWEMVKEIQF